MKCFYCKKEQPTNETKYENLYNLREELLKEKSEIILKKKSLMSNHRFTIRERRELDKKIINIDEKLRVTKEEIHQVKIALKILIDGRESIMIKALNKKLIELGVSKDEFKKLLNEADEEYVLKTTNAREKLKIINNKYNTNSHNSWHTQKGQYDPTAKKALDKVK
jgi:hypothetical protein